MKRARDIRDQLLGLMDRCEIELVSNPQDVGELCKDTVWKRCCAQTVRKQVRARPIQSSLCLGAASCTMQAQLLAALLQPASCLCGADVLSCQPLYVYPSAEAIRKAITSGFFYHTASLQKNGSYRTVKNPQVGARFV